MAELKGWKRKKDKGCPETHTERDCRFIFQRYDWGKRMQSNLKFKMELTLTDMMGRSKELSGEYHVEKLVICKRVVIWKWNFFLKTCLYAFFHTSSKFKNSSKKNVLKCPSKIISICFAPVLGWFCSTCLFRCCMGSFFFCFYRIQCSSLFRPCQCKACFFLHCLSIQILWLYICF